MSRNGLMRTALWTELLEALRLDYPGVEFGTKAGPAISKVICRNADYMAELSETHDHRQEQGQ